VAGSGTGGRTACTTSTSCPVNHFCGWGTCNLRATKLAAGGSFSCVVLVDGSARCWGFNGNGALASGSIGNGTPGAVLDNDILTPVRVAGFGSAQPVTGISAGNAHACALSRGTVWCWGAGQYGELGYGGFTSTPPFGLATPTPVTGLTPGLTVTAIAAGSSYTCALLSNMTVWCWGSNRIGELGRGTFTAALPYGIASPAPVGTAAPETGFAMLSLGSGSSHACGVSNAGSLSCWGSNDQGELGGGFLSPDPRGAARLVGVAGLPVATVTELAAVGLFHTCAVQNDRTTWCWGLNNYGQLGIGTTTQPPSLTPQQVSSVAGSSVIGLGVGLSHSCIAIFAGIVKCWGDSGAGQLGNGAPVSNPTEQGIAAPASNPTPVSVIGLPIGDYVMSLSVGARHTCVLLTSGAVWCWGENRNGQLGNDSHVSSSLPVQVGPW
jgi:alpha-tubulin suppressor-like RCC1 family protein